MVLNTENMRKFYDNLDYINFKYKFPDLYSKEQIAFIKKILDSKDFNSTCCLYSSSTENLSKMITLYLENEIENYENIFNRIDLTKVQYGDIAANLDLVYGNKDLTKSLIQIVNNVREKIFGEYLSIDGIERLFDFSYIEFEWDMHLSANFSKHDMAYYRDHYFHQIRNAFAMHNLLDNPIVFEAVRKNLVSFNGKISEFLKQQINEQEYSHKSNIEKIAFYLDDDFYMRNIIYMSSYLAGLFHDIGYPVVHYLKINKRIGNYMPYAHYFNESLHNLNSVFSFLQNSLLFRLVNADEIRARINVEKPDHGAVSAILFLLHFYENGSIFKSPPYKVAAIELAALAIYNHTNEYGVLGSEEKNDLFKPYFKANPISFLLRIVDDMQEWDRIYFELSEQSNIVLCKKCLTPLIGIKTEKGQKYTCNCDKKLQPHIERVFDAKDSIPYRRVYNVSTCEDLTFNFTKSADDNYHVNFNYNLFKLLNISLINSSYATYRIKELNSIKKLLENQGDLPKFFLNYFMSANPVLIKMLIIEKYFKKKTILIDISKKELDDFSNIKSYKVDDIYKNLTGVTFFSKYNNSVKQYMEKALKFYSELYLLKILLKSVINKNRDKAVREKVNLYTKEILENYGNTPEIYCLIEDCYLQFSRCNFYYGTGSNKTLSNSYFDQFSNVGRKGYLTIHLDGANKKSVDEKIQKVYSDDYYFTAVREYTQLEKYMPVDKNSPIDAFTDLWYFKELQGYI